MTVTATISIPSDAFELGEILAMNEGIRIELTQFVPVEDALIPYFWVSDGDLKEFEDGVRADPRVKSVTALDSAVERTLYRIEWTDGVDGFLDTLTDHEILVESAAGTTDDWTFHLRTHDSDALTRFHNACRENDIPLIVKQVQHDSMNPDSDPYELTEKQREAVLLALEAGYFDVPRGISMTELGDQLEISRQAASRRLSRGLHALITHTLAESEPADAR